MSTATKPPAPFGALLSAITFVSAFIFVAGFSYRWAYYYNFGVAHLTFDFPVQTIAVSATELLRKPENAALTFAIVALALLSVNIVIWVSSYLKQRVGWVDLLSGPLLGLTPVFLIQSLRAIALIYGVFVAGQIVGLRTYQQHSIELPNNPLPRVTLSAPPGTKGLPSTILCDREQGERPELLGRAAIVDQFEKDLLGCTNKQKTWRLLYRDASYVYVFSTTPKTDGAFIPRATTLAVPRNDRLLIILE